MEIEMSNHDELEYRVDSLLLKLVKILDKDGKMIESETTVPEGWYVLPDPGQ